ncbi:MAG: hypothetical protein EB036_03215 [Betaproteobacteria bacterium]|nr:hypothetical protein [Betaproteobacteria bacterium]
MLASADHVMLVLPYSQATHHVIGEDQLKAMKASATLINMARGGIVDDAALAKALQQGLIAAAGLDVCFQVARKRVFCEPGSSGPWGIPPRNLTNKEK